MDVSTPVSAAEHDAVRLLESWWTSPSRDEPLPVDPDKLARSLGIEVVVVPLPADESGNIVIPPPGGAARISLNQWDARNRQRFTCAHEIGHYWRRRLERGQQDSTFVDYRATLAGLGRDAEEVYANQFAAAVLMPGALVKQGYESGDTVAQLAERFGTSEQAMALRLRNLRLGR